GRRARQAFPTRRSSDLRAPWDAGCGHEAEVLAQVADRAPVQRGAEVGEPRALPRLEDRRQGREVDAVPEERVALGEVVEERGPRSEEHTSELQSRENLV